jgi:hypothetical protein
MPYISTEALVGAALLVIVALGHQYIPTAGGESSTASKSSKKKNKKKAKGNNASTTTSDNKDGAATTTTTTKNVSASTTIDVAVKTPLDATPVSGQAAKPKTLAQKIAPQPRKSKVDE